MTVRLLVGWSLGLPLSYEGVRLNFHAPFSLVKYDTPKHTLNVDFSSRPRRTWKVWSRPAEAQRVRQHHQQTEGQGQELLHDEAQDQKEVKEVVQGEAARAEEASRKTTEVQQQVLVSQDNFFSNTDHRNGCFFFQFGYQTAAVLMYFFFISCWISDKKKMQVSTTNDVRDDAKWEKKCVITKGFLWPLNVNNF